MHQSRHASRPFNLVGNPIPVSRSFHRYRRSRIAFTKRSLNRSWLMLQPVLPQFSGVGLPVLHPRVMLVTIKRNILWHAVAPLFLFRSPPPAYAGGRRRAFIFSFRPKRRGFFFPVRSCERGAP